jgi:glucosamine--fructose-6-phosphate aminotransferase (isomerizing)
MCGIVGYAGRRPAIPFILEGLKRLEYRGYDSAGVAAAEGGAIHRRRAAGKLANLDAVLKRSPLPGVVALGHTRWATHGKPSEENAHPHCDCSGELVVIHNGIIENYVEIKERLARAGHKFASETDTEVVAHLIEEKLKSLLRPDAAPGFAEPAIFEAVRLALGEVKGAYALAVLWSKAPDVIISAKTASPLIIGLGEGENFLASDVPAFLAHTRKAVFLEDGEMAVVKAEGCRFFSLAGKRLDKVPVVIQWDRTMAEKGGYRHFMFKEINEQPAACEDTLRGRFFPLRDGVLQREAGIPAAALKAVRQFHLVACGTAYHAGLVGKYWLEELSGTPAHAETASEFRYRQSTLSQSDLVIAISQSGETADTLAAVRMAKEKGAKVLSICNTVGAAIPRAADYNLYTHCGPELGVASTKAFIGQLSALAVFTMHAALARGTLSEPDARELVDQLVRLPGDIRAALKLDPQVLDIAGKFHKKGHFLFIGRGLNYPIALEGALKLKEISYVHAEGYAAGEMKHGPIAIIDEDVSIVAIATRAKTYDKMASNCQEAKARGAQVIALVTEGMPPLPGADYQIKLPPVPELLSPIVNIVPLQLFAYHIADLRGCDVDQPRNLAKSVTVE